jgi:D-alanyl-lipoteichoic acid acyltransferase DltB (MBOAT superfamily)
MVTMLLGGLWHGASWTFVVWGGLHGFYLWVEKFLKDKFGKNHSAPVVAAGIVHASVVPVTTNRIAMGFIYALLTFFLVNVTWVFFRAQTFTKAWDMLKSMFGQVTNGMPLLTTLAIIKVSVIIALTVLVSWYMRDRRILELAHKAHWTVVGICWAVIVLLLILSQESASSFIYFQF